MINDSFFKCYIRFLNFLNFFTKSAPEATFTFILKNEFLSRGPRR